MLREWIKRLLDRVLCQYKPEDDYFNDAVLYPKTYTINTILKLLHDDRTSVPYALAIDTIFFFQMALEYDKPHSTLVQHFATGYGAIYEDMNAKETYQHIHTLMNLN